MNRKTKALTQLIDNLEREASWLLSHADSLAGYGRQEEAVHEWARAGACEEDLAGMLDVAGEELDAAIHQISAASCLEKLNQHTRASTLLRAALSCTQLRENHRQEVEQLLEQCRLQIRKMKHPQQNKAFKAS